MLTIEQSLGKGVEMTQDDGRIGTGTQRAAGAVLTPRGGASRRNFLRGAGVAGLGLGSAALLSACTSNKNNPAAAAPAITGSVDPKVADKYKNKTIGVSVLTFSDENIQSIVNWIKQACTDAGLNWTFDVVDTQTDGGKAATAVDSFVTKKVDAIMAIAVGAGGIEEQLARAKSAGIPTVGTFTFAKPDSSITQDYTPPPAADAALLGTYLIADQLQRHSGSAKIQVGMLDFPLNLIESRRYAFEALIAQQPEFEIAARNYNVDPTSVVDSASAAAKSMLQANPDITAIWVNYPPAALPAASGVSELSGKDVQVYGHIAQSAGVDAIGQSSSPLVATSWIDWPFVGYTIVDQTLAAFAGQTLDKQLKVLSPCPMIVFDKTNVAQNLPSGEKASNWMFAGGAYRPEFLRRWNSL